MNPHTRHALCQKLPPELVSLVAEYAILVRTPSAACMQVFVDKVQHLQMYTGGKLLHSFVLRWLWLWARGEPFL